MDNLKKISSKFFDIQENLSKLTENPLKLKKIRKILLKNFMENPRKSSKIRPRLQPLTDYFH